MRWIKTFENYKTNILLIVDVQKSFKKYFINNRINWNIEQYLKELNNYCSYFKSVYQIWDNHINGKNVDRSYLYHDNPVQNELDDIYDFPNQVDLIEKRYNYDVDVDFYVNILEKEIHEKIKELEDQKLLKKGDIFPTTEGTIIVYIGNNHNWFHCPKKLYILFKGLTNQEVIVVGGADNECLEDIVICGRSLGVNININKDFVYSANPYY